MNTGESGMGTERVFKLDRLEYVLLKAVNENYLDHNVYTPVPLCTEILNQLGDLSTKRVLVFYSCEMASLLVNNYNCNPKNLYLLGHGENQYRKYLANLFGINYCEIDWFTSKAEYKNMKFDVIVGNPPYEDSSQDGGQNKIYMQFCKQSLSLLKDNGIMAFLTPTSALKKSKRFTLVGMEGLKRVDFTANDHFNVGIKICSWIVDKTYKGYVTVKCANGESQQSADTVIYDHSSADVNFTKIYEGLKAVANKPDKRMFRQNNFGPAMSKTKDAKHTYPLYKMENGQNMLTYWSRRIPYFVGKEKLTLPMTKGFNNENIIVDILDYDVGYLTIEINSNDEIDNIKSFIFSDYFKEHVEKWKLLDGYGYNYALKYLPPFDKTRRWSNNEVKDFIESFKL